MAVAALAGSRAGMLLTGEQGRAGTCSRIVKLNSRVQERGEGARIWQLLLGEGLACP